MKPSRSGGPRPLRKNVSLLFGIVFLLASLRWVVQGLVSGDEAVVLWGDSRFWLVGSVSLLFFSGLVFPRVQWIQPYVFLVIAVIPFLQSPEGVYGFGLFAVGAIMLFVDGRLRKQPIIKLSLLGAYLLTLLVLSTLITRSSLETALAMLLFMITFFLFLFLTFQDKIIVFVKAYRPVISLSEAGLTQKESAHLFALLEGKSTKEIAWSQGVKESTIRNSLSRAYHKLGFTDKTQLLQWAESNEIKH